MTENEIATIVVDTCYHIHAEMGPGLFESVYEEIISYELIEKGFFVERQKAVP
jgi:GxxExxY protein